MKHHIIYGYGGIVMITAFIIPSEDLLLGPEKELLIKNPLVIVAKEEFPAKHSFIINVALIKTGEESDFHGKINIIKEKDGEILYNDSFVETLPEDTGAVIRQEECDDFIFPEPGVYVIKLISFGETQEVRFNVIKKNKEA